jgi:hypothetical protein
LPYSLSPNPSPQSGEGGLNGRFDNPIQFWYFLLRISEKGGTSYEKIFKDFSVIADRFIGHRQSLFARVGGR